MTILSIDSIENVFYSFLGNAAYTFFLSSLRWRCKVELIVFDYAAWPSGLSVDTAKCPSLLLCLHPSIPLSLSDKHTCTRTHIRTLDCTVMWPSAFKQISQEIKRGHWIEVTSEVHDIMADVRRLQPSLVVKQRPSLAAVRYCNTCTATSGAVLQWSVFVLSWTYSVILFDWYYWHWSVCYFSVCSGISLNFPWMCFKVIIDVLFQNSYSWNSRAGTVDINLLVSLFQSGRLDSHYPKVCGHQGKVLDIKWNPFFENIIASCSEDTSVSFQPYTLCNNNP